LFKLATTSRLVRFSNKTIFTLLKHSSLRKRQNCKCRVVVGLAPEVNVIITNFSVFLKSQFIIQFLHNLALFWVKNDNFSQFFIRKYFKIITSVPGEQGFDLKEAQDWSDVMALRRSPSDVSMRASMASGSMDKSSCH
jgi:hypothetical protein